MVKKRVGVRADTAFVGEKRGRVSATTPCMAIKNAQFKHAI